MILGSRLLAVVVVGSAFAIFAAGGAQSDEGVAGGVMARPIEQKDPQYPQSQADEGREGWVELSYVVATDGTTKEILIEDFTGSADFEEPARKAVEAWRFEAATLDGTAVEQCHTRVRMLFTLDQGKKAKRKASKEFIARFEAATKVAVEGDPDALKAAIDELAPRNLSENAYTSFLSAIMAQQEQDPDLQLIHLRRATVGGVNYLQPDLYVTALETTFGLQANRGEYASALLTYQALANSKRKSKALKDLGKVAKKIEALIAGDSPISIVGEIGLQREGAVAWGHRLSRRSAGIEDADGELERIELRCDFHRAVADLEAAEELLMPEDWGNCFFYVFGEEGAQFRIVEYAE